MSTAPDRKARQLSMTDPNSESEQPVMIKVVLSREQRDKFKGFCALNGSTMNDVLKQFIDIYIEAEGKIETISKTQS